MRKLETILADHRSDAAALQRQGHVAQARSIEAVCDEVAAVMRPYLTIMSESEARLRTGWSTERLRARFVEWESRGLAMLDERGKRRYREIVLPVRPTDAAAKLAGARGEPVRAHG